MSRLKQNAEALHEDIQALIDTQAEYYKLWSFKAGMKSVTLLIHVFLIGLFVAFALLFLSGAAAFSIGAWLNSDALGFLIVGAIYVLAGVLAFLLRDRIDRPILTKFSEIFFHE
jgi:hypothetical protein